MRIYKLFLSKRVMKMELSVKTQIIREGDVFVAYAPELDVSSCGDTVEEARRNLREAVELFIETAREKGALKDILEEAGFHEEDSSVWQGPEIIAQDSMHLPISI
jgi:predicted RNase H-like HicB family nuclease